jgi:hypothetical protein
MKHYLYPHPYIYPRAGEDTLESFTKGLVAAGCISAFQDVTSLKTEGHQKRVLRHALQGGTALAAGTYSADALRHGDYLRAVLAAAAGAEGVLAIERAMNDGGGKTAGQPLIEDDRDE